MERRPFVTDSGVWALIVAMSILGVWRWWDWIEGPRQVTGGAGEAMASPEKGALDCEKENRREEGSKQASSHAAQGLLQLVSILGSSQTSVDIDIQIAIFKSYMSNTSYHHILQPQKRIP